MMVGIYDDEVSTLYTVVVLQSNLLVCVYLPIVSLELLQYVFV